MVDEDAAESDTDQSFLSNLLLKYTQEGEGNSGFRIIGHYQLLSQYERTPGLEDRGTNGYGMTEAYLKTILTRQQSGKNRRRNKNRVRSWHAITKNIVELMRRNDKVASIWTSEPIYVDSGASYTGLQNAETRSFGQEHVIQRFLRGG